MRALFVFLVTVALGAASAPGKSLGELEKTLADWRLGCAGCASRLGWGERELATFVAGRLASLGFPSKLARSGEAFWVLVAVGEGWVPVLPGLPPADREGLFARGTFLGRIPRTAAGALDPRYLSPEEVLVLPPNAPPTVRVRVHPALPQPGEPVWFIVEASDPDGTVIQVWWNFGDGETSWLWSPDHVYAHEGVYEVTLTVVDDRGGATVATARVEVVAPLPMPPSGGCGCGR
ncbi:MAG: PKD domain-containing protein [Candidatus Bipolaricaulota bacterium]|nr:PKD domain-containing protein [Candidatus Bipolaricaulota bacterium]